MKRGKHKKPCQLQFRKKLFSFHQYWIMYFTERYLNESEKDFVCFIKARSYHLAKKILRDRLAEEKEVLKVKAIQGYMLHKDFKGRNRSKLSIQDWDDIKSAAFPNLNNFLFKKETPRPENYTNRFNQTDYKHLKTIGFKKGKDNWSTQNRKGLFLPPHQRKGKKWNGDKWIKWDKAERIKVKNEIINALILNNHNRSAAARYLKVSRNTLYKLLCRCESMEWWNEKYPIIRMAPPSIPTEQRSALQKKVMHEKMQKGWSPFSYLTKEQNELRVNNLIKAKKAQSEQYLKSLVPKIKSALENNQNIRSEAAKSINVKPHTFRKWIRKTAHLVDWNSKYPNPRQNKNV